jgi:hypothetical protein
MNPSVSIALFASGLFLLAGMLTGVWKYAKTMSSPEHRAPAYVNLAHLACFFYSFACLVIAKLIEHSPFPNAVRLAITIVPIVFFVLTVAGYIREGFLNRTENMFAERNFVTTTFMHFLIAGEIGGFALVLLGFAYSQFIR